MSAAPVVSLRTLTVLFCRIGLTSFGAALHSSSAMMYFAARWWRSKQDWQWRRPIERGLAPVALGLIFAAVITVIQAAHMSIVGIGVALACAGVIYFTRVSASMLIAVVGLFYTGPQFV